MKVHNFVLLFIIVFLSLCVNYDLKQETLTKVSTKKQRYDAILEAAINDAAASLVTLDRGNNPTIQKEEAINTFFQSLYAGFGILHDETAKQELKGYVPVILITERDGFCFWYHGEYEENGRTLVERFSEKYPYAYSCSDIDCKETKNYVGFTMDDTIYMVNGNSNGVLYGTRQDIFRNYPEVSFLQSKDSFEEVRRETIVNAITDKMGQYINRYNRIADRYGISYQFSIPYFDKGTWVRTIDDISIVVLFQGYPFGNGITQTYNQYEIGGARVSKNNYYYITQRNGTSFYHRGDCESYINGLIPYDAKRDCALMGAYPCEKCKP